MEPFEEDYEKNRLKDGGQNIYRNACKDIMDSAVQIYIKKEKFLI